MQFREGRRELTQLATNTVAARMQLTCFLQLIHLIYPSGIQVLVEVCLVSKIVRTN